MRGSRIFRQGGPGQFFLVLSIFYRSQMVTLSLFKVPEGGPTFSRGGGGDFFQTGSNCLFPIETNITCDFL